MRKLIFIHGAGDDVERPDGVARFLKASFDGVLDVSAPQMPEGGAEVLGNSVAQALAEAEADTLLVGHSLGASMLIKVIAERLPGFRASALVLLAPPFWGHGGWDYEEFFPPEGYADALTGIGTIVHMQGRDDEIVSPGHQARYGAHLPRARLEMIEGVGHDFEGAGRLRLRDTILAL